MHEIPDVGPAGRGKAIANLVRMEPGERIATLQAVREWPALAGESLRGDGDAPGCGQED